MTRDPRENDINSNKLLSISTIFKMKGFLVLQLTIANREEGDFEQIMNLLPSEETMNSKARTLNECYEGLLSVSYPWLYPDDTLLSSCFFL